MMTHTTKSTSDVSNPSKEHLARSNSKASDVDLTVLHHPQDLSKLISVRNKLVFNRDTERGLLHAKLKLKNKSIRYVTFVVRPSDQQKFKIRPKVGYIPPKESIEIVVTAQEGCTFQAISLEYFGIFALPIYDLRLLERKNLDILWRAQGTKMFPFEAAEFHRVAYILPRSDNYLHELTILDRVQNMSHMYQRQLPADGIDMAYDPKPVDESAFFLNWPPPATNREDDHTMEVLRKDWEQLTIRINNQTRNMLESIKTVVGMGLCIGTTMIAMYSMYSLKPFLGIGTKTYEEYEQKEVPLGYWEFTKKYFLG